MDLHYKQEVTVGALVLVGATLFVVGTLWLGGKDFSHTSPAVAIAFADAGTLKRGSPVKISGVQLGTVEGIDFESYGRVIVRVTLDETIVPKRDAAAELATVGLVADAIVNFNPGQAPEPLPDGTVIQGTVARGITDIGTEIGDQAKQLLGGLNKVEYERLSRDLSRTLDAFQRLASVYSDTKAGPVAELTTTMGSLQRVSARIDSVLAAAQLERTLRAADSMMATLTKLSGEAQSTAKQLDQLLSKVNRGEGTLGKFASDTLFYENAQKLLKSLQEFVDDIKKHPGKIGITVKLF
ncbi:MAG: MCE family protein [Gemmatimonadales bacterium]|nr:MCE family protein [Gemmatimonadales bacterium]